MQKMYSFFHLFFFFFFLIRLLQLLESPKPFKCRIYSLYALKVISSCAFGVDVDGKKEEMRAIVNNSENPFFTRVTFPIALQGK